MVPPPKAERGRWDPFPTFPADVDTDDDEEDDGAQEEEEGPTADGEGVPPEGEWLEALARHVEQQLGAASAGTEETTMTTPAAAPTRSSARVGGLGFGVLGFGICVQEP